MPQLILRATDRPLLEGDLNAHVTEDALEVPRKVAEMSGRQDIRTAMQLLSYGEAFPSAFTETFGWTPVQVSNALTRLGSQLGAASPKRRMVAFGARPPRDDEKG